MKITKAIGFILSLVFAVFLSATAYAHDGPVTLSVDTTTGKVMVLAVETLAAHDAATCTLHNHNNLAAGGGDSPHGLARSTDSVTANQDKMPARVFRRPVGYAMFDCACVRVLAPPNMNG